MHSLKIREEEVTAAPWGGSCERVHDRECFLVKGSAHWHSRLYERAVHTVHAWGELGNRCAMLIPPACPRAALRNICPGCWSTAWGEPTACWELCAVPEPRLGWDAPGRGHGPSGVLPASQIQAVGHCELLVLGSSKVLCIQKVSSSLRGSGHEGLC